MAALWDQRVDLACALRWAVRLGLHEGICNHFSLAVADEAGAVRGDRFLINPHGWHWSEITASSLALCDAEGRVLEGDNEVETTAFCIHSRIHLNAPHAVAVLHTHMPYASAITVRERGRLAMCEQKALMFHDRLAYDDDYEGLALDTAEGDRMASKLGNSSALMLASHGVICTGRTIAQAFTDLYYLERAAQTQILAQTGGHALRTLSDRVIRHTAEQMARDRERHADTHFTALRRILDSEEPAYRE